MAEAIRTEFDKKMPGFATCPDALVHGAETRTSSPVRILRDRDTLQSPKIPRLFPAGEGAGHAGGIVSSAVDGLRIGDALLRLANEEAGESEGAEPANEESPGRGT